MERCLYDYIHTRNIQDIPGDVLCLLSMSLFVRQLRRIHVIWLPHWLFSSDHIINC